MFSPARTLGFAPDSGALGFAPPLNMLNQVFFFSARARTAHLPREQHRKKNQRLANYEF